jgi:hypothetical protein
MILCCARARSFGCVQGRLWSPEKSQPSLFLMFCHPERRFNRETVPVLVWFLNHGFARMNTDSFMANGHMLSAKC